MPASNDPEIRILGPESVPATQQLWRQSGLAFPPDGRDSEELLTRELADTDTFLIGAFEGDRLVGVALGTNDGHRGWISRVAVVPDRHGAGFGRALIRVCEAIFESRGIGIVTTLVDDENGASLDPIEGEGN